LVLDAFARAAYATVTRQIRIFGRELVPANAVSLTSIQRGRTQSAKRVLASRYHFKVGRVYAGTNAAEMVYLLVGGDRPDKGLIGCAMHADVTTAARHPSVSISLRGEEALPNPARRIVTAILDRHARPDIFAHSLFPACHRSASADEDRRRHRGIGADADATNGCPPRVRIKGRWPVARRLLRAARG
jgi:hypothetical protein